MSSLNLDVYMPIVILFAFGFVMLFGALLVGKLIRPNEPTDLKSQEYECGEAPVGQAWTHFNVRFYVVSLIFIIFDVEAALMFPVSAVFRDFVAIGQGGAILGSFALFVLILALGIVYCWSKGDFDWVRSFQTNNDNNEKASIG